MGIATKFFATFLYKVILPKALNSEEGKCKIMTYEHAIETRKGEIAILEKAFKKAKKEKKKESISLELRITGLKGDIEDLEKKLKEVGV